MHITKEHRSGVVVVSPEGRLDSVETPHLEEVVLGIIEGGETRLVLDLSAVPYVSSRGLRAILLGAKKAAAGGGELTVSSLQIIVKKVIQAAGFQELIGIFETTDEAVTSLAGEQP